MRWRDDDHKAFFFVVETNKKWKQKLQFQNLDQTTKHLLGEGGNLFFFNIFPLHFTTLLYPYTSSLAPKHITGAQIYISSQTFNNQNHKIPLQVP